MLSRRDLLHGAVIAPFAAMLPKIVSGSDCAEFAEFKQVGGTPYISSIKIDPSEKRNWPGCLRITCTMKHDDPYSNDCVILEHLTWEHLYDDEEMMEYGLKSFLLHKEWFAKKLYDEARKPLQSLQHVPEFSHHNNPVKLKLCCIEYCGIDKESGRLLS